MSLNLCRVESAGGSRRAVAAVLVMGQDTAGGSRDKGHLLFNLFFSNS